MDAASAVADNLRLKRMQLNESRRTFCQRIFMAPDRYADIEQKRVQIRVVDLPVLIQALGESYDWWLSQHEVDDKWQKRKAS